MLVQGCDLEGGEGKGKRAGEMKTQNLDGIGRERDMEISSPIIGYDQVLQQLTPTSNEKEKESSQTKRIARG